MKVSICVNQPGYLPDSEIYPYIIEDDSVEYIADAIYDEFEKSYDLDEDIPFVDIYDDVLGFADGDVNGVSYDLADSGYILTVERVFD